MTSKQAELLWIDFRIPQKLQKATRKGLPFVIWRRYPESNWGIKVLQTSALPLGYSAVSIVLGYCITPNGKSQG